MRYGTEFLPVTIIVTMILGYADRKAWCQLCQTLLDVSLLDQNNIFESVFESCHVLCCWSAGIASFREAYR